MGNANVGSEASGGDELITCGVAIPVGARMTSRIRSKVGGRVR